MVPRTAPRNSLPTTVARRQSTCDQTSKMYPRQYQEVIEADSSPRGLADCMATQGESSMVVAFLPRMQVMSGGLGPPVRIRHAAAGALGWSMGWPRARFGMVWGSANQQHCLRCVCPLRQWTTATLTFAVLLWLLEIKQESEARPLCQQGVHAAVGPEQPWWPAAFLWSPLCVRGSTLLVAPKSCPLPSPPKFAHLIRYSQHPALQACFLPPGVQAAPAVRGSAVPAVGRPRPQAQAGGRLRAGGGG